jgi:hypothetical protein
MPGPLHIPVTGLPLTSASRSINVDCSGMHYPVLFKLIIGGGQFSATQVIVSMVRGHGPDPCDCKYHCHQVPGAKGCIQVLTGRNRESMLRH